MVISWFAFRHQVRTKGKFECEGVKVSKHRRGYCGSGVALFLFISLYLFLSEKLSVPSVFIRSASTSHMQRLRGLRRCKVLGGDEGFHEGCCWVCLFVSFFKIFIGYLFATKWVFSQVPQKHWASGHFQRWQHRLDGSVGWYDATNCVFFINPFGPRDTVRLPIPLR